MADKGKLLNLIKIAVFISDSCERLLPFQLPILFMKTSKFLYIPFLQNKKSELEYFYHLPSKQEISINIVR